MTMFDRKLPRVLVLSLALASGAALAQDAMTAAQVRATLQAQGYTHIDDVEFDDGMWKADARSADGTRVDVRLDAKTGKVFPERGVSNLGEADVRAKLAAAGYTKVRDVKFDDGLWKAEADDAAGKRVELRLDPATGDVVGKARD